jgi:hypothetical protein
MRKILIGLLIVFAALLAFLPQILSTSFGKPFFERALGTKFDAKVTIGRFRLSWFGPQDFEQIEFSRTDLSGSIESASSNVPFWYLSEFKNGFSLSNGFFSFPRFGALSIGPVNALVAGHDVQVDGKASQGGSFSVNGKIYSKSDFDVATKFQKMPSAPFDQLLKASGILSAGLGPTFDLSMTALYNQGEGRLDADLSSPNSEAALRGRIAEDALLLKEPFRASLNFTQDLSQALGGRVLEAKNPITLRIETAGASIPLHPFSLELVEIGQATLDLGRLVWSELHPLISLFALLNNAKIASSKALVWFTPLEFAISKGTLQMGRVDALIANSVHLCGWGNAQLSTTKLDMRLGIPADTLEQSLGISSLSRNYVLQIPVSGTLQNPKFDTGPAAAKIAALVAGKQISKFSKKAGALGGLFSQMPLSQEDKDVPPPKRPFPWEK